MQTPVWQRPVDRGGAFSPSTAVADVKIAFIDPLSGGGAATGILAQKTHQFYIDAINAAGGSTARSSSCCRSTTRSIRRSR